MRTLNSIPAQFRDVVPMDAGQMRIAMLSIHSCPIGELGTKDTGGMNVYIRELARELGTRGHQVDVYTRRHDPKDSKIIELNKNVRLIHLRAGRNGDMHKLAIYPHLPDFSWALENFRKREGLQYDLVHSHYWLSGRVGKWAQDFWNVPHILMFHTLGAVKNGLGVGEDEPELRLVTEKQLIKTCNRIIASTQREMGELMHHYGALPDTIGVVPCGVNLDLFRPVDKANARRQLGFDPNERIVLYVGRFAPLKGLDRLLAAMTYLRHTQALRLVIIGGDGHNKPESQKLKRLSEELRIQDAVTFAGRAEQGDLPPYYSAADVLVLPSHHESFGLVALESLACGTPVVATKVGAMEIIVREGETGCVLTNATPRLLANKIGAFLSKARAGAPSADAVRASVVRFGWSNIADAMIEEYRGVIRRWRFSGIGYTSPKVSHFPTAQRI
jgi:D-inositol-3-phosphate glycosyltransferase